MIMPFLFGLIDYLKSIGKTAVHLAIDKGNPQLRKTEWVKR